MARQRGSGLDQSEMISVLKDVLGIDKPTGKDTSETHDINIKITDTGADGVAKNINKIASAADNANKSVSKLNTSLNKTNNSNGSGKKKTNALTDLNKILGSKSGLKRALRFSDPESAKQGVLDAANDYKSFIEEAEESEKIYQAKLAERNKLYSRLKDLKKSPNVNSDDTKIKIGSLEAKIKKIDNEKEDAHISNLKGQIEEKKENLLQQIHAFLAIDDSVTDLINEFDDDFLKTFINDNKQSIIQDKKGASYTVKQFKSTFEIIARAALENGIETVQNAIQQAVESVLSNKDDYIIEDLFDNFVDNDMMNNDAITNFKKGFKLSSNTKNAISNLTVNSSPKNRYAEAEIQERIMYDWVQHLKSTSAYNKNDSNEERALLLKRNGLAADEIIGEAGRFFPSDYKKYGATAIAHSHQYDEKINYLRFSDSDIRSLIDPEILANGVNQFLISCGEEVMSLTLPKEMDSDDLLGFKENVLDFYARAAAMYGGEIKTDKNGNISVSTKNLPPEAQNKITDLVNYWLLKAVEGLQEDYADMSFDAYRLDHESGLLEYNDTPIYKAEEIANSTMAKEFLVSGMGSNNLSEMLKALQQKYNVQVIVDSSEAEQKVEAIEEKTEKLESEPVETKVEIDTTESEEKLEEIEEKTDKLESESTKVKVEADTSEAEEELEDIEYTLEETEERIAGLKRAEQDYDKIRATYDDKDLAESDDITDNIINATRALDQAKQDMAEALSKAHMANNRGQEYDDDFAEYASRYQAAAYAVEYYENQIEQLNEALQRQAESLEKVEKEKQNQNTTSEVDTSEEISEYDKLQEEIEQTIDSYAHLNESKEIATGFIADKKEKKGIFKNNEESKESENDLKKIVNNLISDNAIRKKSLFAPKDINSESKAREQLTETINKQADAYEHLDEVKEESQATSNNTNKVTQQERNLAKRIYNEALGLIKSRNDEELYSSADFLNGIIKEAGQDSISSLKKKDYFKELSKRFSINVDDITDLSNYRAIENNVKNKRAIDINSYKQDFLELSQIIDQIREKAKKGIDITNDDELIEINQLISRMKELYNTLNDGNRLKASEKSISSLQNRISTILNKYPKMGNETKEELLKIRSELDNVNQADLSKATAQVNKLEQSLKDTGKTGKTFAMTLTERFKSLGIYLMSFVSFYDLIRYAREGFEIIHQLDDALTEMAKVSDEPLSRLKEFQTESYGIADQVGTTSLTIQQSTADWMRLGETLDEAKESAKDASILFNVSEFESIDEATESLVAMSQAYDDLGKMDIIDKLNNIGNNFSISTDGLATALQLSASSLKTAGK